MDKSCDNNYFEEKSYVATTEQATAQTVASSSQPPQHTTPESFMQKLADHASLSIILCTDSIKKTRFLRMLTNLASESVFYLDTDLLYTGCTNAGLCKNHTHTTIYCPDQATWHRNLADVISVVSTSKGMTVIIDSLNGVYEMFEGHDSAISANTHIMALASLAVQAGSSVIVSAMVKKRKAKQQDYTSHTHSEKKDTRVIKTTIEEWILYPSGRQIPKIAELDTFLLKGTRTSPLLVKIITNSQ